MKKMLIGAFAGAFALCAQAEITTTPVAEASLPTGTSFESLTLGGTIDFSMDDTGGDDGSYWCTTNATDTTLTVSNLTDYAAYDKSCGVPAIDGRTTNEKYVKIDANNRVYRTAVAGASIDSATGAFSAATQLNFEEKPLFFDSMVLFTATDGLQTSDISSEDKLVVWLYGYEDGGSDTLGTGTNLVITAGYYDQNANLITTNYVASSVAIEPNTWHRLTIKALRAQANVGGSDEPISGFQVWVDGEPVSVADGEDSTVSFFPSRVPSTNTDIANSKDACSIVGVAFKGNGAVDDVSFTATAPEFAQEQIVETFNYTVTVVDGSDGEGANEAFENLTYTIGENTEQLVYDGATANKVPVFNGSMTLTVTLNDGAVKIADNEGWTASQDGLIYTKTVDISDYAANSSQSLTITLVMAGGDGEQAVDGSGNNFTVPTAVDTTLKNLNLDGYADLNSFQKITDPVSGAVTYSTLTYGQAYALGVLDLETGDIGDVPAVTISFNADGQPVVSMGSGTAKTDVYTITCTLVYKDDLGATGDFAEFDPKVTAEIGSNLTDTTASERAKRFYQVKVTITDK